MKTLTFFFTLLKVSQNIVLPPCKTALVTAIQPLIFGHQWREEHVGLPEASEAELWGFRASPSPTGYVCASPFGRDAEERGEEGCIMCRIVSNDFFIPPLTCSAGALPKGEPHVEKRSLQNRISASSHMIQRRRQISLRHSPTSLRMTRGVCGGSEPPPYGTPSTAPRSPFLGEEGYHASLT